MKNTILVSLGKGIPAGLCRKQPGTSREAVGSFRRFVPGFCRLAALAAALFLAFGVTRADAQWVTETYPLQPGWSAIWLAQDCSYDTIENVLVNQPNILEVWRWNPLGSAVQYTDSASAPIQPDVEWIVWRRGAATNALHRLSGNAAYLIHYVGASVATFSLTGRPLLPNYAWTPTGLNFVGYPVPGAASSTFTNFFGYSAALKTGTTVNYYIGGDLGSGTGNRNPLLATSSTTVKRNQAYWVQGTTYNDYYGPLNVNVTSSSGLDFADKAVVRSIRVRNTTDPAKNQTVTATLATANSVAPPNGQEALAGAVPLLVRGAPDATTGQYTYAPLTSTTLTLAPGEEQEVVISLNRSAINSAAGSVFQSLLKVTDSLGMTSVNLPVRAVSTSLTGLWIGVATVTGVDQIIEQGPASGAAPTNTAPPAPSVVPTAGGVTGFPLRLIVHMDSAGRATLLQEAYVAQPAPATGTTPGAPLVFSRASYSSTTGLLLPQRVSSASFPLDLVQSGTGQLGTSGSLVFNVALGYDQDTNPFKHAYHPDHDNFDALYSTTKLKNKQESYTVSRAVALNFQTSLPGVSDPTWGSTTLGGNYTETLSGLRAQDIHVSGLFILHRVSDASTLVSQ